MKQVQEKLKSEGLYKGQVDGIAGPETKQALEQFQKQQSLQQTGSLDQQTLDKLGVSQTEGSGSSMPPSRSGAGSQNNR
jgi:peptidoglycan hydrolase-like protein with peptidoglycan-binding domain